MELEALKYVAIGLLGLSLGIVGVAISTIFTTYIKGAFRNPEAAPKVFTSLLLGFALTEAIALFALVLAILVLFF